MHSGVKLLASRRLSSPRPATMIDIILNKQAVGKTYKKDLQKLEAHIGNLNNNQKMDLMKALAANKRLEVSVDQTTFNLDDVLVKFEQKSLNVFEENYVPHVIEPSFGLGRIIHCLLEHSFKVRDQRRTYLNLRPKVAPVKVVVLPLIDS